MQSSTRRRLPLAFLIGLVVMEGHVVDSTVVINFAQ